MWGGGGHKIEKGQTIRLGLAIDFDDIAEVRLDEMNQNGDDPHQIGETVAIRSDRPGRRRPVIDDHHGGPLEEAHLPHQPVDERVPVLAPDTPDGAALLPRHARNGPSVRGVSRSSQAPRNSPVCRVSGPDA